MARSRLVGSSLAVAWLLVSGAARADGYDIPTGTQPLGYSARPLTLPQMTLSPRVDALLDKLNTATAPMLYKTDLRYLNLNVAAAASFGIVENIEIGAVALPLQVLPHVAYGDPSIHGTFRFVKGGFELAAYINTTFITQAAIDPQLTLPVVGTSAGVLLQPGLLSRIHMGQKSKLDIGATVPIQLGSGAHDLGLNVPLEFAFNIVEAFHLGVTSGFGISNFKAPALDSYIPLGFITGVAIGSNDKPVVDIGALFRWPQFANPGAGSQSPSMAMTMGQKSTIDTQDFQVGLSVAAYVYFM